MFWLDCWFEFGGKTGGLFCVLLWNGREFYLVVGWFGFVGRVGGKGGWLTGGLFCILIGNGGVFYVLVGWFGFGGEGGWTTLGCSKLGYSW